MKKIIILIISAILIPVVVSAKDPAKPLSVDTIHVLKISPQDKRAIIKTPDGKMQIIKPGDSLGTSAKVAEIAVDRIVIEEKKGNETEKVIIRLVNGKQKIERIRKTAEQAPAMLAPAEKNKKANKQGSGFQ